MRPIRTLVVDDEPLARRRLRRLLRGEPDFAVVGEIGDGPAAVTAIADLDPDLVLLDVQMPEMSGLDVLDAVGPERLPALVFVTAYDRYAVDAFDHHAVDYLLKPVDADRFRTALARVRTRLRRRGVGGGRAGPAAEHFRRLLAEMGAARRPAERFLVRGEGRSFFLRAADVEWVEASRNRVRLHVGRAAHSLRTTLTAIERQLDSAQFRRISRSALVNLDRVRELQPWFHGDAIVILQSGARLTLSRRYRHNLLAPLSPPPPPLVPLGAAAVPFVPIASCPT
jgi:two-component system LytT family response regulator